MVLGCCGWTFVLSALLLYKLADWLIRKLYIGNYGERYILVTGCDTGFGNLLTKRLDALGCHVFAGCLTEAGRSELKAQCSDRLQPIALDVSKPQSVREAYETVKSKLPTGKGLWGIMNNAGVLGTGGWPDWQTIDDYKQVNSVNFYGLIDVTITFLPLVKMERGRVVNTASVFGRMTLLSCIPYCASKYGVEAFTDGLRRAMKVFGVKAMLIEPGLHKTNITSHQNTLGSVNTAWERLSDEVKQEYGEEFFKYYCNEGLGAFEKLGSPHVEHVVDAYEHALLGRFPRARYLVGKDAKFLWMPIQWLPEWLGDLIYLKLDPNFPKPAAVLKKSKSE